VRPVESEKCLLQDVLDVELTTDVPRVDKSSLPLFRLELLEPVVDNYKLVGSAAMDLPNH
jgi:hypothetical protein